MIRKRAMRLRRATGTYSILGAFVAFALSAIPVLLLVTSNRHYRNCSRNSYDLASYVYLEQQTRAIAAAVQAQGFSRLPVVHPRGAIFLSSGDAVKLSPTPGLQPDRLSDAITWIETQFEQTLEVYSVTPLPSALEFSACFLFGAAAIAADMETFIAVSRDGLFEMREGVPHPSGKHTCLTLTLRATESVAVDPAALVHSLGIRFIVPLNRVHCLYRDTQGTLRIAGFRGSEVIENQPLRERAPFMRFAVDRDELGLQLLRAYVHSIDESLKPKTFSVSIFAARKQPLTIFTYL